MTSVRLSTMFDGRWVDEKVNECMAITKYYNP